MRTSQGFTLVEILVAIGLFTVLIASVLPGLLWNAQLNNMSDARTQANMVTQQTLDRLRNSPVLSTSGSETAQVTQGRTFTVLTEYCPGISDPLCSNDTKNQLVHIRITVSYGTTVLSKTDTVYTQVNTKTSVGVAGGGS